MAASVVLVDPRCGDARAQDGLELQPRLFDAAFRAEGVQLVVALHADEATDAAFDWSVAPSFVFFFILFFSDPTRGRARAHSCAFAVVPCCVFADSMPRDGLVRTYEQLLVFLERQYGATRAFLPMQGRNIVLHSPPAEVVEKEQ